MHEEEEDDFDATLNDDEMDEYCRKFSDFMMAWLQKRISLRLSINTSMGHDQNKGTSSKNPPKLADKGKGIQYINGFKPEVLKEDKSPSPS